MLRHRVVSECACVCARLGQVGGGTTCPVTVSTSGFADAQAAAEVRFPLLVCTRFALLLVIPRPTRLAPRPRTQGGMISADGSVTIQNSNLSRGRASKARLLRLMHPRNADLRAHAPPQLCISIPLTLKSLHAGKRRLRLRALERLCHWHGVPGLRQQDRRRRRLQPGRRHAAGILVQPLLGAVGVWRGGLFCTGAVGHHRCVRNFGGQQQRHRLLRAHGALAYLQHNLCLAFLADDPHFSFHVFFRPAAPSLVFLCRSPVLQGSRTAPQRFVHCGPTRMLLKHHHTVT